MGARRQTRILALLLLTGCEPDALQKVTPLLDIADDAIDFGAIPEGETAVRSITLSNPRAAPVESFVATLDEGSSDDFEILTSSTTVPAQSSVALEVRFRPSGAGLDEGAVLIRSEALSDGEVRVSLRGGPIQPGLEVSPDPIDFGPATTATVVRTFTLRNVGTANLTITALEIATDGNPDFMLRPWEATTILTPNEERSGAIDYVRTNRATAGRLLVSSDDPETPNLEVRLLPDPYRACEDGEDNDGDRLIDFPDDPGCASLDDDDESNPPECQDGTSEACGSDIGECALGTRTCMNRIWGPCEGDLRPTPEACDGLDNDCDTRIDEEVTGTCTINGCAGARGCVESSGVPGGEWGVCIPTSGAAEACDGLDNNCNGEIDEGIVESCMVNGCAGTRICVPGGMGEYTSCQINTQPEVCNGIDDDCNGTPDDNIPPLACGQGICAATAPACVNGSPGMCTPGPSATEVCNNLDDDCDGTPDNPPALSCGVGECARTVPACVSGSNNQCVEGTPNQEVCNGLDDDCNGTPDDGIPNLTCGQGICFVSVPACIGNMPNTCTPGPSATETCNNLDDDCDGTADNNLPDLTCGVGECARTVPACSGGADNVCVPGMAVTEICNGLDDDCDGTPDNGVCTAPTCGLVSTGADPQEPNNSAGGANPVVPPVVGTQTFTYDVTLTAGDTDWIQFDFPAPGAASIATMNAQVDCVDWGTATGCPSTPTVGLAAWYFDDVCSPGGQQDSFDNGQSGLAAVSSSGSVSPFGICTPQRFRLNVFSSASICAGEALNAEVTVTVSFQ